MANAELLFEKLFHSLLSLDRELNIAQTVIIYFNPNRMGEAESSRTLFINSFLHKKGVWRSQILWLFLIHYELSKNQKKNGFSQCFEVI